MISFYSGQLINIFKGVNLRRYPVNSLSTSCVWSKPNNFIGDSIKQGYTVMKKKFVMVAVAALFSAGAYAQVDQAVQVTNAVKDQVAQAATAQVVQAVKDQVAQAAAAQVAQAVQQQVAQAAVAQITQQVKEEVVQNARGQVATANSTSSEPATVPVKYKKHKHKHKKHTKRHAKHNAVHMTSVKNADHAATAATPSVASDSAMPASSATAAPRQ
ncbi:hypothetical protein [Paraburkholderia sp. J11-2]|uniref:hypothetical protein n=1 Tax=Paraburkholderia sp. J11-2 TaxID=2805431 RepID=UPI002AB673E1|nr:hypothetical protein [Paraburkholderia sp. J11-2]